MAPSMLISKIGTFSQNKQPMGNIKITVSEMSKLLPSIITFRNVFVYFESIKIWKAQGNDDKGEAGSQIPHIGNKTVRNIKNHCFKIRCNFCHWIIRIKNVSVYFESTQSWKAQGNDDNLRRGRITNSTHCRQNGAAIHQEGKTLEIKDRRRSGKG